MKIPFLSKKKDQDANRDIVAQATDADKQPQGKLAQRFFATVDKAAQIQEPAIDAYVKRITNKNPNADTATKQDILDKHFVRFATGTGAGTGGVALVPGIGTLMSLGAVAAESLVLIEVTALYALASAKIHNIDISDEDRRRAVIYVAVAGSAGDDVMQLLSSESALGSAKSVRGLLKKGGKDLTNTNSVLGRIAFRQARRKLGGATLMKVMPFGIGAALGAKANHAISKRLVSQVRSVIERIAEQEQAETANAGTSAISEA